MTIGQPRYAPGCPVKGQHSPLADLRIAFPWIEQPHNMAKAVTAFGVDCTACTEQHRTLAGQHPGLVHQALWLWLSAVAVTRVGAGLPPVATAADMMDGLFKMMATGPTPITHQVAGPTQKVLNGIPLSETATPEGWLANTWQHADAEQAVDALHPEHRELVWTDLITLLSGWHQGAVRAHRGAEGTGT